MVIRLYDKQECPFCWRLRMALTQLELDWQRIDYADPKHEAVWKSLTPFNTVPVLQFDELVLADSSVAVEYLDDCYPGIIWPEDIADRAMARTIARYADDVLGSTVRDVVFEKRDRPQQEWDQQRIQQATEKFHQSLPFLDQAINKIDLMSEQMTMAEMVVVVRLGMAKAYGLSFDDYPQLAQWIDKIISGSVFKQTTPLVVKTQVLDKYFS